MLKLSHVYEYIASSLKRHLHIFMSFTLTPYQNVNNTDTVYLNIGNCNSILDYFYPKLSSRVVSGRGPNLIRTTFNVQSDSLLVYFRMPIDMVVPRIILL